MAVKDTNKRFSVMLSKEDVHKLDQLVTIKGLKSRGYAASLYIVAGIKSDEHLIAKQSE